MPASLIDSYPFASNRYDELLEAKGKPREHWQAFANRLERLPIEELEQRAGFVRNAIEADGITYNVYADPKGAKRPWGLDLLPRLEDSEEWNTLSHAVAQRATLLNAILADLYGPQTLLSEGLLPPALVFGQHGYKWPCRGAVPPGGIFLHSYAVDLGRSPDGRWWAIADRTQGPSGAGYALQNRIIISRAFPEAFHELRIQTLASYFRGMQDTLNRMAPTDGETPLIVLLTPGPYNETYFEHAFLARYLGFPLVEGQDLTVRDDTVFLKTLRGLRRVHAIMRRLDDDFCDPLELRADSALGIPGLLGAVRAGRVLMANALGSGVLEAGALFGFLPAICRRLLGEPLAMPSVASWWCGEEPALRFVLDNLDALIIKPAFSSMHMDAVFGHSLKGKARQDMIEKILAQPHAYVAQEWVQLAQAPVWSPTTKRKLAPRSSGLRMFASATPNGYSVMPGGLGRIAPQRGMEIISLQRGGLSKDTWVSTGNPVEHTSMLKKRLGVIDLLCTGTDIPSRVGETLFWMGRYSERCEASARLLRAALTRVPGQGQDLRGIFEVAKTLGVLPSGAEDDEARPRSDSPFEQLLAAISDLDHSGSVAANLRGLAANANKVRERLSSDNWHTLNHLSQALEKPPKTVDAAISTLDAIMLGCIALAGFAMDDMTRDEGWGFLILGRRIERLSGLSTMMRTALERPPEARERSFDWLLEAADSIVTYRARYRRMPELLPVVHLLIFDTTNPHSIAFQIKSLRRYLERVARELGHTPSPQLVSLERELERFDLTQLEAEHCEAACQSLAGILANAQDTAYALSSDVHRRFFTHTLRASRRHRKAA